MNKSTIKFFALIIGVFSLFFVISVPSAEAANPYIQNVSFGQDENGDYISFDWVDIPPNQQEGGWFGCTRDIVSVWFNRSNPNCIIEGSITIGFQPGDLVATAGSYSGFGNYAFASGLPDYSCTSNDVNLGLSLPQHIKTYINPNLFPERLSFSAEDFVTIQLAGYKMNIGYSELLVNDDEQYFYHVPSNPLPIVPYTNVKFGFDENDLLKVSFDWAGPSRDIIPLVGFNGKISDPFYARFDPDFEKDVSMSWEDGHNENLFNVNWFTGGFTAQKGQHYEIFVNELHKWTPSNQLRVCSWYYPCPVNRTLTESVLGRSFNSNDYITIAFNSTSPSQPYGTSYILNDPNKYYFVAPNNPPILATYMALGDSFSSGFGIVPFEEGTRQDLGFNDCQRSENAYPQVVAEEVGLDLSFHACQGATTKHMYERRVDNSGNDWSELPQLEYLNKETKLVTLTIGGNDSGFGNILTNCVTTGFGICSNNEDLIASVNESFTRLDGGDGPENIKPYDLIYKDIRTLAPDAKSVAVGYPHLFTASGDDRTFLPGGRCEGVKKADQRWMIEKIDELNDIIKRNALRNGLLFALPIFDGHELCSGGEEWILDLLSTGRFHPTVKGHEAIAEAVINELTKDEQKIGILINPFQTLDYAFSVESGKSLLSFTSGWPGSDVITSLRSPLGVLYTRNSNNTLYHANGATWEHYEISNP